MDDHPTDPVRVLIANEPRSYREVLGRAIAGLRPGVAVTIAEPDQVDSLLAMLTPQVVVISRPPMGEVPGVCRLVMLYPDGSNTATIHVDGVLTTVADLELDALLALIDATRATEEGAVATMDQPAA